MIQNSAGVSKRLRTKDYVSVPDHLSFAHNQSSIIMDSAGTHPAVVSNLAIVHGHHSNRVIPYSSRIIICNDRANYSHHTAIIETPSHITGGPVVVVDDQ